MAISRTRLLMMGVGDAATVHHYCCRSRVVGDPFLGLALPAIVGGIKKIGGLFKKGPTSSAAKYTQLSPMQKLAQVLPLPAVSPQTAQNLGIGIAGIAGAAAAAIAGAPGIVGGAGSVLSKMRTMGGAGGVRAVARPIGLPGMRHRRHMRSTNIKALGRATRRLASFHRLAMATERHLSHLVRRRAAPQRRRK